jgi:hypothetical protein
LRTARIAFQVFVGQHEVGITNLKISMTHFAAWHIHAQDFGCAEGLFVEFNRASRSLNDQVRRGGVIAGGEVIDFGVHNSPSA